MFLAAFFLATTADALKIDALNSRIALLPYPYKVTSKVSGDQEAQLYCMRT